MDLPEVIYQTALFFNKVFNLEKKGTVEINVYHSMVSIFLNHIKQ